MKLNYTKDYVEMGQPNEIAGKYSLCGHLLQSDWLTLYDEVERLKKENDLLSKRSAPSVMGIIKHRSEIEQKRQAVIDAAKNADCTCSVKERMSGHRTECTLPPLFEAREELERVEGK